MPNLSLVVPCYNEEEVLPETARRLAQLRAELLANHAITADSRIYLVDDGSSDQTWSLIREYARDPAFYGIKLSRNRGHQSALMAGLLTAEGDVVISVDADLQDDLGVIPEMLESHHHGADIVCGVRKSRATDKFAKRATAEGYYRFLRSLGVEVVFNHADYRLLSRRALEFLREYTEVNLFLRGVIPQIGLRTSVVYYDRAERFAGQSKYPLRKMLALAWDGVTSFSAFPLRIISALGVLVFLLSMLMGAWTLWIRLFTSAAVPGWASTLLPVYTLSGLQLLCLGIIGEYLAKVYLETKRRPRYLIEEIVSEPHRPSVGPSAANTQAAHTAPVP